MVYVFLIYMYSNAPVKVYKYGISLGDGLLTDVLPFQALAS